MSIETFTKQEFEIYLSQHQPYQPLGLVDGEETYLLPLDGQVAIAIRSSVKANGISAATGEDSIRLWLVDNDSQPLGSKVSRWTTRLAGWQDRLSQNIKTLCEWRAAAGDCPECQKPKGIFKVKKVGENKGRPFAKCNEHNNFIWLDEERKENVYFSKASHGDNGKIELVAQMACEISQFQANFMQFEDTINGFPDTKPEPIPDPALLRVCEPVSRTPNEKQGLAIEADVNANLRVLAPPGSGKTFVIEHRYKFLVDNGISPDSILVVTFSKQMADEMGKRIIKTCPIANLEQISTIHAFCFRLLTKWDITSQYRGWQVPENWKVKKQLEDTIGLVWKEKEKPGYNEVLDQINLSKYHGFTSDEAYTFFVNTLGQTYGKWLYDLRCRFDAWLKSNRFMLFADMLYLVEQRLKKDAAWRAWLQGKFSHIIIDESQDINYQAMRILVTISLESGKNTVYE
jgi:hypothetical protein